ncbi:MAG: hypothetical protein Q8P59_14040, partial [Dehalococcoidia bacterium]|nr:hypothetical protein [Dehalococcoidia bacterium]
MREPAVRYRRLIVCIVLFALAGIAMLAQIANIQIVQHDYFKAMAMDEHWGKKEDLAHRGTIRDRTGHPLATTTTVYDLYVVPGSIKSREILSKTAKTINSLLQVPEEKFLALHSQSGTQPALLQANVPYDLGVKIMDQGLPGIQGGKDARRVYPEGNLASNVLGLVGKDHNGLMGIEAYYNADLAGKSGTVVYERDSVGNEIPLGFRERIAPQEGADLFLTIDRYIQRLADKEIDQAMKQHQGKSATIIVMDPKTGAILAMASRPSFDITRPDLADASQKDRLRSRAV